MDTGLALKWIFGVAALIAAGLWLGSIVNSTSVCEPYRDDKGYLEDGCMRYPNDQADLLLRMNPHAFIENEYDLNRLREHNEKIWAAEKKAAAAKKAAK